MTPNWKAPQSSSLIALFGGTFDALKNGKNIIPAMPRRVVAANIESIPASAFPMSPNEKAHINETIAR